MSDDFDYDVDGAVTKNSKPEDETGDFDAKAKERAAGDDQADAANPTATSMKINYTAPIQIISAALINPIDTDTPLVSYLVQWKEGALTQAFLDVFKNGSPDKSYSDVLSFMTLKTPPSMVPDIHFSKDTINMGDHVHIVSVGVEGTCRAVIIGDHKYDTDGIVDFLQGFDKFDYAAENVTVLNGTGEQEQWPTKTNILAALVERLGQSASGDFIFVYYTGACGSRRSKQYLVPTADGGGGGDVRDYIGHTDLYTFLKGVAHKKVSLTALIDAPTGGRVIDLPTRRAATFLRALILTLVYFASALYTFSRLIEAALMGIVVGLILKYYGLVEE